MRTPFVIRDLVPFHIGARSIERHGLVVSVWKDSWPTRLSLGESLLASTTISRGRRRECRDKLHITLEAGSQQRNTNTETETGLIGTEIRKYNTTTRGLAIESDVVVFLGQAEETRLHQRRGISENNNGTAEPLQYNRPSRIKSSPKPVLTRWTTRPPSCSSSSTYIPYHGQSPPNRNHPIRYRSTGR